MDDNNVSKIKKSRKSGRLNVLDIIIIIFVIFIIALAIIMTIPKVQDTLVSGDKVQISYKIVFRGVDSNVFDKISDDETVVDAVSGRLLGTVLEQLSESNYNFIMEEDANGILTANKKETDNLGKIVTVTITADAVYKEGLGYTVDGYRIACGKEMQLRFKDFTGTGYCDSITVNSAG